MDIKEIRKKLEAEKLAEMEQSDDVAPAPGPASDTIQNMFNRVVNAADDMADSIAVNRTAATTAMDQALDNETAIKTRVTAAEVDARDQGILAQANGYTDSKTSHLPNYGEPVEDILNNVAGNSVDGAYIGHNYTGTMFLGEEMPGHQYYGAKATGEQAYGEQASGAQSYGFQASGTQSYGQDARNAQAYGALAKEDIIIGSSSHVAGDGKGRLKHGTKQTTFENIIDVTAGGASSMVVTFDDGSSHTYKVGQ